MSSGKKKGTGTENADLGSMQSWPFQNMPGKQRGLPKGNESYPDRYDDRYDNFPEVRALPPPLLAEWRANRDALEGQTET